MDEAREVASVEDTGLDSGAACGFGIALGQADEEGSLADDRPHAVEEAAGAALLLRRVSRLPGCKVTGVGKAIGMGPFGCEALLH